MESGKIMKWDAKMAKGLSLISQMGLMMAIPIFGCLFLGNYLDKLLGTGPLLLLIFIIIGVLASFRNLYVYGMKYGQKKEDKDHEGK